MAKEKLLDEKRTDLFHIDFRSIDVDPTYNARTEYGDIKELAESILINGVQIPIMVKRNLSEKGRYTLIRGHRRFKACQLLYSDGKIKELRVPAMTVPRGTDEIDLIIDQETSNNGKPLTIMERAELVSRLLKHGLTEKEISTRLVKSNTFISNCILLLEAPIDIKDMINKGKIRSTLIIDIFKKEKSFDGAVELIRKLNDSVSNTVEKINKKKDDVIGEGEFKEEEPTSEEEPNQQEPKITNKDLLKLKGKFNSVSFAKKVIKSGTERVVRPEKKELFDFVQKLIDGEYDKTDLEIMFFEPTMLALDVTEGENISDGTPAEEN